MKSRLSRTVATIGFLTSLALTFAACASAAPSPTPPPAQPAESKPPAAAATQPPAAAPKPPAVVEIPLGLANVNLTYPGFMVGEALGIFEQHGVKPVLTLTQTSTTAIQALLSKSLGIAAITTDAAILAQVKAPDLVLAMPITVKLPLSLVTGPRIKSVSDLRGGVLGASNPKTADAYVLRTILAQHGLQDERDYTITVSGDPTGRVAALRNGKLDGIALVEPQVSQLKAEGFTELVRGGVDVPRFAKWPQIYLVTTRSWAKANEDALVRYLRASLEAHRVTYDPARKDEVVKVLANRLKIEEPFVQSAYQNWVVQQQAFSRDGMIDPAGIQIVVDSLIETGDLQAPGPKPAELVDGSYVEKARAPR